jgi:hypothetical protein
MSEFKITGPGKYRQKKNEERPAEVIFYAKYNSDFKWVGLSSGGVLKMWDDEGRCNNGTHCDLIAPYTEPRLRPWKMEEVPLGAWVRYKVGANWQGLLTDCFSDCITVSHSAWAYPLAFEKLEHSTDGGKTWHPCGVVEEVP